MKRSISFPGLIISLSITHSYANPITKSCQDYNQSTVLLLDQLLPLGDEISPEGQNLQSSSFKGKTFEGKECEVNLSRLSDDVCGVSSKRYRVFIKVMSEDYSERECSAELVMDVDLKINSESFMEYKNTIVYPQLFSSDFHKIKAKINNGETYFYCHSFVKDRPGYRIGHNRSNNCMLR